MRRWLTAFAGIVVLSLAGYSGLGFYALQASSVEINASCAIGDSGTRLPRFACRWYLDHQLSSKSDSEHAQRVLHLAIGAYPTDGNNALEIAELALSEGAQINGHSPVSGYSPLHEAIIFNEPLLAAFLLRRGANPTTEDLNKGLTVFELLSFIQERNPDMNFSEIEGLIKQD